MNIKEFKEALKNKQRIEAVSIIHLKREPTHPNEIVNKKRGITPEMAIRLAERFGTTAEFWLGLQMDYDLWKAYNRPSRKFKKKNKLDLL